MDANGEGSKGNPFATVGHAVEVAISKEQSVCACADATKPFDEVVEATGDVTIYGGFVDCEKAWTYDSPKKSAWTAPADSVPLVVGGDANPRRGGCVVMRAAVPRLTTPSLVATVAGPPAIGQS